MGTRSVIAIPQGDGWKGRYCHWDGYPSGVGEALHEIVNRDGYEVAIKTLTEDHPGWSVIDAGPHTELRGTDDDGRFVNVPGYGVAYTDTLFPNGYRQASFDDWITSEDTETAGTEWAYVLAPKGITVLESDWNSAAWKHRGHFPYDTNLPSHQIEESVNV